MTVTERLPNLGDRGGREVRKIIVLRRLPRPSTFLPYKMLCGSKCHASGSCSQSLINCIKQREVGTQNTKTTLAHLFLGCWAQLRNSMAGCGGTPSGPPAGVFPRLLSTAKQQHGRM